MMKDNSSCCPSKRCEAPKNFCHWMRKHDNAQSWLRCSSAKTRSSPTFHFFKSILTFRDTKMGQAYAVAFHLVSAIWCQKRWNSFVEMKMFSPLYCCISNSWSKWCAIQMVCPATGQLVKEAQSPFAKRSRGACLPVQAHMLTYSRWRLWFFCFCFWLIGGWKSWAVGDRFGRADDRVPDV